MRARPHPAHLMRRAALLLALLSLTTHPVRAESWWRQQLTSYRLAPYMAALTESRASGDWRAAVEAADHILAIDPGNDSILLEKLHVLYEHQHYDLALKTASRINETNPVFARAHFIKGLIYFETGQLTEARAILRRAGRDERLPDAERRRARDLLDRIRLSQGYLVVPAQYRPPYVQPNPPVPAIELGAKALNDEGFPRHTPPPQTQEAPPPAPPLEAVFEALRAGRAADALTALDNAEAAGTGAIVHMYRGYVYLDLERQAEAIAAFRQAGQALALDDTTRAAAWAQIGYLAVARENYPAAIAAFRQSAALSPPSRDILLQLGYAQAAALCWQDAVETLETAAMAGGGSPQLFQDVGYAARNAGEDARAAHWFRRALDDPAQLSQERALALKQEVEWLEDRFDMSLYSAFRGNAVDTGALNPLERSVLQSQGGMGFRYIPEGMGREIGRFAALTGRLLWSYEEDGLAIPSASWQAGLGMSLRPFSGDNLVLGAERLIAVGQNGRNDWLLRAGYSWSSMAPASPWPHARLYLDAALIDPASPDILTTGDLQLGRRMAPQRWLTLWPHVTLAGNWQDDDFGSVSLLEAGPGITATLGFDEGLYRAWQASLSISLQYRIKVAGSSVGKSGPLLTISLRR